MENKPKSFAYLHIANIVVIFGILLTAGLMFVFIPIQHISVIEKRKLEPVPVFNFTNLWAGKYTRNAEAWYADHFPFRDHWIGFTAGLSQYRGFKQADKAKIIATVRPQFMPEDLTADSAGDKDSSTDKKAAHSLLIYEGKAFQLFGGSTKTASNYASKINYFQSVLGDSIKFYNVLIPSSSEMYLPDKYLKMARSEKTGIQSIYNQLNSNICAADAYGELYAHKSEYLYFGTDHHWTGLGAYYAYTAFAKCAGFTAMNLQSLEKRSRPNFLGTLYALSQDEELAKNPDHVDYYIIPGSYTVKTNSSSTENNWVKGRLLVEGASGGNSYGVFLGADYPVMKIENAVKNGRRILVLKESFGNAFTPFLVPHFETVYVADIRYFRFALMDFISKNKINEVLVINGIFMANNPYFPNKIKSMMYQASGPISNKKNETADEKK